jgi:predicted nucleic acid-binding protein
LLLDAGFLVAVDRDERAAREFLTAALIHRTPLTTTHPVVAQVWRDGARQARLARLLAAVDVVPLDDGAEVGRVLARTGTADVVDAHLVITAVRRAEPILTGDVVDLEALAAAFPAARPPVFLWPPPSAAGGGGSTGRQVG